MLSWSIASVVRRFNLYRHQRISPASIFMKSDMISILFYLQKFSFSFFFFFFFFNSIRREKLFNKTKEIKEKICYTICSGTRKTIRGGLTHTQLAIEINEAVAKNMNYSLATLSSQPNRIWTAFCALVNPFVTTSVAINIYHHKGMCIEHRRIHLFTAGFNILFCFYTVRVWCWLIILKIKKYVCILKFLFFTALSDWIGYAQTFIQTHTSRWSESI